MRELTEKTARIPGGELFRRGLIAGIGWTFGATLGFVIVSTIVIAIFRSLGGLPVIGSFIANIVEETQTQMIRRNPIYSE